MASESIPPHHPLRRYLVLLSAFIMQACLGATYAWGVFVNPVREMTGLGQGAAHAPFSAFYLAFPATVLMAGILISRFGPRKCAVAGSVLFGLGWILASLGARHYSLTILGIGAVAGIGVGMAYLVPITVGMQWFPKNKGLVTGFAVGGFGAGAIATAAIAEWLMAVLGQTPFEAFRHLGLGFLFLAPMAALPLTPPATTTAPRSQPLPAGVLGTPLFRILYLAMFTGLSAGFVISTNLKQIVGHDAGTLGVTAIAVFAAANSAGRLIWGALFDRMSASSAVRANLAAQSATMLLGGWFLTRGGIGLQVLALLAGLNYGGVLVIYAATTARAWGSKSTAAIYGVLFSANMPAALTPILAGMVYDVFGGFQITLVLLAAALAGVVLVIPKPIPENPVS